MLRNISYLILGGILIIGLFFKFMHWPGAALIITSIVGISIALLEHVISNIKSKDLRNIIYPLLGIVYVLGVLFKVMHWPGAGNMLIVSIIGTSIALAQFAFSIRNSVSAILPLLYSITWLFVLFRIMHWPEPPYVLYGSYFAFAILVPAFLFARGLRLKNTDANLSGHFMVIAILSLILCLVEFKLKLYPEVWGMELYQHYILDVFLFSGLVLAIRKTLQIEKLKLQFENDYKILKCLKCIYMIILVLCVLVKAN